MLYNAGGLAPLKEVQEALGPRSAARDRQVVDVGNVALLGAVNALLLTLAPLQCPRRSAESNPGPLARAVYLVPPAPDSSLYHCAIAAAEIQSSENPTFPPGPSVQWQCDIIIVLETQLQCIPSVGCNKSRFSNLTTPGNSSNGSIVSCSVIDRQSLHRLQWVTFVKKTTPGQCLGRKPWAVAAPNPHLS